jgi:hypothetical protein
MIQYAKDCVPVIQEFSPEFAGFFMVLLHFEWVELPPNSHFREGKESLDSPRPPRSVAAHYTDCPYSEKQIKPPPGP